MQKKILVLALAAAISSPAFADTANVTVYGTVDMAFGGTTYGAATNGTAGTSTTQVSSQVTKLGFKGAEDMGDGVSAVWQIEQQLDIDAAGSGKSTHTTFAGRNSYGGLKSDSMGTVLLGIYDTPYKVATRKLDVFADQIPDNRGLMGGGTAGGLHDARLGNSVAYVSPDMNGFSAAVSYVAGAEAAATSGTIKGSAWSLAGMYNAGPLYAALAYSAFDVGTAASGTMASGTLSGVGAAAANDKLKAWKLGAGYTMDALQLNLVYEDTSSSIGGIDKIGRKDWYVAGKYSFGNDDVKLAYTHAGEVGATAATQLNSGAKQFSLGYDHSMSKRTTVYVQYTKLSNDAAANYTLSSAGSTMNGNAGPGAGSDPSAWGVGMKHSF